MLYRWLCREPASLAWSERCTCSCRETLRGDGSPQPGREQPSRTTFLHLVLVVVVRNQQPTELVADNTRLIARHLRQLIGTRLAADVRMTILVPRDPRPVGIGCVDVTLRVVVFLPTACTPVDRLGS